MHILRSVAESVSTIIMTAVLTAILLVLIASSISSMEYSSRRLEFEQLRTTYISIAQSIPLIMGGGDFSSRIPVYRTSIGYRTLGNINLIIGTENIPLQCTVLESRFSGLDVAEEIYYGALRGDKAIVFDQRLIPMVYTSREGGTIFLRLDTCRIYSVVEVRSNISTGSVFYLLKLSFVNITPVIEQGKGGGEAFIYAKIEGEKITYIRDNVTGQNIKLIYMDGSARGINDIYPEYPGGPIRVQVEIYNLKLYVKLS